MIFYGWGSKDMSLPFGDGTTLVLDYRYFHIMWVLSISFGFRYSWFFATPSGPMRRPLTPEEVIQFDVRNRLHPAWWWRYGLWVFLGAVVLFLAIAILFTQGTS